MARFGRGFRDRKFQSKEGFGLPRPIKVGEEYDVEITETGSKGDGIARIKNFVVFVNGTKKGDKVRIKITEVRNRFGVGKKVEAKESKDMPEIEEAEDVTEEVVSEAEESEEEY